MNTAINEKPVSSDDGVEFSFDPARLDLDMIHRFLSREAYWSLDVPRSTLERAVAHSLCIGAYRRAHQIGFARLTTDRATFAYLGDVFVVAEERGFGIARRMVRTLLDHDDVKGLRRILLFTADAHALYRGLGFSPLSRPERGMEILRTDSYRASAPTGQT